MHKKASENKAVIFSFSFLFKAEAEVKRLDQLKASKMKELFLKKKKDLEEICNRSHMEIPSRSEMDNILNLINSGGPNDKYPFLRKISCPI